jgi:integrase
MTKFELNQIDVKGDGKIILYQRPRKDGSLNPVWQMRLKVTGSTGYHRKSTGLQNQDEAIRAALNLQDDLRIKVLAGGELNARTFKSAYDTWKIDFPKLVTRKSDQYVTERIDGVGVYPLSFFAAKKIDAITKGNFTEYWIWRRENSTRTNPATKKTVSYIPSDNTLRKEAAYLKVFLSYCTDKGWMAGVPDMNTPALDKSRRPSFTLTEWRKLTRSMREWVQEGQSWGGVARDRLLIQQYILLLANCGARIGEFRHVVWHDFSTVETEDGNLLVARVTGKTGPREIVFQSGSEIYLKRIYDLRKHELNDDPPHDNYVFCHKDGKPIGSFKKGFDSLLNYCGLVLDAVGKKRTLYSLRHFYATMRLSEAVSPYLLAQQMGTSIQMLERFYGHVVTRLIATQITKTSSKGKPFGSGANDYPFETSTG